MATRRFRATPQPRTLKWPANSTPIPAEEVQTMKKLFQLTFLSFAIVAISDLALAQQQDANSQRNPLVRLLQTKGISTDQEAAMINETSSPPQAERRLA